MEFTVHRKPLRQTPCPIRTSRRLEDDVLLVDFGKAVYGTLEFTPKPKSDRVVVHLGEKLNAEGRLDRAPGATIRYRRIEQAVTPDSTSCRLVIPPDERNTDVEAGAILMPDEIGEVFPFRYAEIEGAATIDPASIQQIFVHYPFDDEAADFSSSDQTLNRIWELCKHTIKATTFCGVYIDGDRERIPYEGDAYINQLGHYCLDQEYEMARWSHEYMIQKPTWCTEWHLHSVMMAWMDILYSGETTSARRFYETLKVKTLIDFARDDGLISVDPAWRTPEMEARLEPHFQRGIIKRNIRDVLDWPPGSFAEGGTGERDNHDMRPVNTVTNAFHAHTLGLMGRIAGLLGHHDDEAAFSTRAAKVAARIQELLFDPERGIYIDGEGSDHASLHSNMFMLAFDLVPTECRNRVVEFIKSRGMACSVYGAQHLLEGLYKNGEADYALGLMTARHDRSWWNMLRCGSTMTLEAWDVKYKGNLDWNHAWGAAPANIIGRYLLGVRPLTPGFAQTIIQPQPGTLKEGAGTVPTPLGPVRLSFQNNPAAPFELTVQLPDGMTAQVGIPYRRNSEGLLLHNGTEVRAMQQGGTSYIHAVGPGRHSLIG